MGAGNSIRINIHLDRTNPIYFPGEAISGIVNINVKKGCVKVNEIFITFSE